LKDTNTKKNRYTINVLADDSSFEKKDRSVNEPIFFYTGGTARRSNCGQQGHQRRHDGLSEQFQRRQARLRDTATSGQ